MTERRSNPAFLNGVPEMLMLQLLSRRPMYGYELVQAIRAATHDGSARGAFTRSYTAWNRRAC
jgi:PadR family transcriptional regulator PadR